MDIYLPADELIWLTCPFCKVGFTMIHLKNQCTENYWLRQNGLKDLSD